MKRTLEIALLSLLVTGCGDDTQAALPDAAVDAPAPDANHSLGICDPVEQDCTGTARCTLNHLTPQALFCDSTPGQIGPYVGCTPTSSSDDCQKGDVCVMTGQLNCRRFCYIDSDCLPDYCAIPINGTGLHVCAQHCQVLNQTTCSVSGESCYLGTTVGGRTTQQCSTTGSTAVGGSCIYANQCVPGAICIIPTGPDAGTTGTCRQGCDQRIADAGAADGGSPGCPDGLVCTGYPGQTPLGYCNPPG